MFLAHYGWWFAAIVLVILELLTGTVYVLMVALGFLAGGLAAYLGANPTEQVAATLLVGLSAVAIWHQARPARQRLGAQRNPDVILDIGAMVEVHAWNEGHARVAYRGSTWDALPENPANPVAGKLYVKAVEGSTLILGPDQP